MRRGSGVVKRHPGTAEKDFDNRSGMFHTHRFLGVPAMCAHVAALGGGQGTDDRLLG